MIALMNSLSCAGGGAVVLVDAGGVDGRWGAEYAA